MNILNPTSRYREYLGIFGITDAGDRVAELRDLDLGNVRFFAYAGSGGLRLKAAITPSGMVTPGAHAGDDWYGFLSGAYDAISAAERIAWLETDASTPLHGLPSTPAIALPPDCPPVGGVDPALWAFVTAPVLLGRSESSRTLTAWFLAGDSRTLTRWTVIALPGAPAVIKRTSAFELLTAQAGSTAAAVAEATARARRLLAAGTDNERLWALQHIGEIGDRAAVSDVAALLANTGTSPEVRRLAAGTLARLADPTAVVPLGAALCADPSPEVRRACAYAIGCINNAGAVQTLGNAASHESDATVCAEIIHALAAQGSAARIALAQIVNSYPEASLRNLAHHYLDSIKATENRKKP